MEEKIGIEQERSIIINSGLFDEDFYLNSYQESMDNIPDPLTHYLKAGITNGYKPRQDFDPIIFKIVNHSNTKLNPLTEYILRNKEKCSFDKENENYTNVKKIFSNLDKPKYPPSFDIDKKWYIKKNKRHVKKFSQPLQAEFIINQNKYQTYSKSRFFFRKDSHEYSLCFC